MVTIKKIRIKNFRSIVDETFDFSNFNFFVGINDCGKSNVLKALNLFFNNETDFNTPFIFENDYSRLAKRGAKQAKEISIEIDLSIPDTFKEHDIKTWKKTWRLNGLNSDNRKDLFSSGSKGQTLLSRIEYLYIPAVKSNEYFKHLLSQVYSSMTKTADGALKELNEKYSEQLQALTKGLSHQLRETLGLDSALEMPRDLNVLFQDLSFSTTDEYVSAIDLKQRGDGVKARHIPSILRYIQKNTEKNKLKNSISHSYIWGFEEPENGVEFLSCYDMANELYSYSKDCQIFITTHSPAFYSIKDSENTKCYYVYKNTNGISKYDGNLDCNDLNNRIGLMPLVAPYIKGEKEKYLEQVKKNKELISELEKLQEKTNKIIILTEGKTDTKHLQIAFENLAVDSSLLKRLEYFRFDGVETLGEELGKLLNKLTHMNTNNMIIGIFDRDKHIFNTDKNKPYASLGNNVYKFNIPALENSERKKDDSICIEHYYSNDEIRTQTDFGRLYLGMDFNGFGKSLDDLWVFQNYAKNQSITDISIIDRNNTHLQQMSNDSLIITKDDFADYVVNHPTDFCFDNFRLIFDVIKQISEVQ